VRLQEWTELTDSWQQPTSSTPTSTTATAATNVVIESSAAVAEAVPTPISTTAATDSAAIASTASSAARESKMRTVSAAAATDIADRAGAAVRRVPVADSMSETALADTASVAEQQPAVAVVAAVVAELQPVDLALVSYAQRYNLHKPL
jgi:hypothetical protein